MGSHIIIHDGVEAYELVEPLQNQRAVFCNLRLGVTSEHSFEELEQRGFGVVKAELLVKGNNERMFFVVEKDRDDNIINTQWFSKDGVVK